MKQNTLSNLILIAYLLMMIVSLVSAVDLFTLSHPSFAFGWIMSVAIEISIAALLIVNRRVPGIKSVLYVLGFITLFQICANTYSAYIHIENISPFAELFALDEWEVIDQKRMLAFATGGVLPAICLALIYIQNEVREQTETNKTDNKEPNDKAYNTEDTESAEDASSPKSHIDQPTSESESEETPTLQQQDESAKDTDINTESEEQAEIATEQLPETEESNDQSEATVEPEAAVEEPKKRKYTKKSTSKSTSKTTKKAGKKTKTTKSNKKPKASKASKKAEEQTSADEVSVTDVPESDPDSQSQESVAELAERLNDIRRGKPNPVSNGYSMML